MCFFVFVNLSEEAASHESEKRFSCRRVEKRRRPQTDPRRPQEPLGFCCALIEISNFFRKSESGLASQVVGGAAQQRNTMRPDRSCCSLFPPLRS